jgi:GNAT superfamily N-acetyltransferase
MTQDLELRYVDPVEGVQVVEQLRDVADVVHHAAVRDPRASRIVAYRGTRPVGIFVFEVYCSILHARGTLVAPARRGEGVGTALWLRALDDTQLSVCSVTVVSARALRMLRHIEAQRPHVRIRAHFGPAGYSGRAPPGATAWVRDHR